MFDCCVSVYAHVHLCPCRFPIYVFCSMAMLFFGVPHGSCRLMRYINSVCLYCHLDESPLSHIWADSIRGGSIRCMPMTAFVTARWLSFPTPSGVVMSRGFGACTCMAEVWHESSRGVRERNRNLQLHVPSPPGQAWLLAE